jgi:predicted DNA binding protein
VAEGRFYLYLRVDPAPVRESILEVRTAEGLVVAKPVVYREGVVRARLVGEPPALQDVLEAFPAAVEVDVRAVGEYTEGRADPVAALSDRQREALEAALELGYFEQPRAATHADVAERLGCASSTASEHLQKAQASLVRAIFDAPQRSPT